jgi:hypothetical protein
MNDQSKVPRSNPLDINNDGVVDSKDLVAGAKKVLGALTPSKNLFDINGDGRVDSKDALDAMRITGAAIAGAGVTFSAGAVAGSVLITGKVTAIASVIASAIGSATAAGLGVVYGTVSSATVSAVQLSNGVWILGVRSFLETSPTFVSLASSTGALVTGTATSIVDSIAGLPVLKSVALKSLVSSNKVLVIAGVPIAREVAIAAGLVAVVVVGGYAYYVLTRDRVSPEDVDGLSSPSPLPA